MQGCECACRAGSQSGNGASASVTLHLLWRRGLTDAGAHQFGYARHSPQTQQILIEIQPLTEYGERKLEAAEGVEESQQQLAKLERAGHKGGRGQLERAGHKGGGGQLGKEAVSYLGLFARLYDDAIGRII